MKRIFFYRLFFLCLIGGVSLYWSIHTFAKEHRVNVIYSEPDDAEAVRFLQQSGRVDAAVDLLNKTFVLKKSITVVFDNSEAAIADYNAAKNIIPYGFVSETHDLFKGAQKGDKAEVATLDALEHTLLHEFTHILIRMYQLPIITKEEDVADSLATLLLLSRDNSGKRAIHAAELYHLEREPLNSLRKWDFMTEHSLSIQHYYQMMCYVYGSARDQYKALKRKVGFTQHRAELCVEDYQRAVDSWSKLLKPYIKKNIL